MRITQNLFIDEKEIIESFIRSSGPGGQNVNKVSSAVQLRFDVAHSSSLPEEVRARLLIMLRSRLTNEGVLILNARRYRSQERNRQDARHRLAEIIYRATLAPKRRIATKPSQASKEARLATKAHRSRIKRHRQELWDDDEGTYK